MIVILKAVYISISLIMAFGVSDLDKEKSTHIEKIRSESNSIKKKAYLVEYHSLLWGEYKGLSSVAETKSMEADLKSIMDKYKDKEGSISVFNMYFEMNNYLETAIRKKLK